MYLQPRGCTRIGCRDTAGPDCKNVELIQPNGPECQPICRVCRDEKPVTTRPIRPTIPSKPVRPTPPAVDPREVGHIHVHACVQPYEFCSWQCLTLCLSNSNYSKQWEHFRNQPCISDSRLELPLVQCVCQNHEQGIWYCYHHQVTAMLLKILSAIDSQQQIYSISIFWSKYQLNCIASVFKRWFSFRLSLFILF